MNLHLVGGFLGSGKTTAIIQAAKAFINQGRRVGVITNDQGKYLVDTAFFRLSAIPTLEVAGGCFCCNYDDLNEKLGELVDSARPDVIFAESVGSCADIVATVVKPLLALRRDGLAPSSFSVFADVRLLYRRLLDQEMPFNEDVVYIFDKQIEEAGLLVINKTDLVSEQALEAVQALLVGRCPQKKFLFTSALTEPGTRPWLEQIQTGDLRLASSALDIDYARYGAGEAQLAWYDVQWTLHFPVGNARVLLQHILRRVLDNIQAIGAGIGHLKFIIQDGDRWAKLSFPSILEPGDLEQVPEIFGKDVSLLVNARAAMPVEVLRGLVCSAVTASGVASEMLSEEAFHPGQPKPTFRMVSL